MGGISLISFWPVSAATTAAQAGVDIAGQGLTLVDAALWEAVLPDSVVLDVASLTEARWRAGLLSLKLNQKPRTPMTGTARFFNDNPQNLWAAAQLGMAGGGGGTRSASFSMAPPSPARLARRPRYPVDAEDPITQIRLRIAQNFREIYLGVVPDGPPGLFMSIPGSIPVFTIDPTLLRNPQDWLTLLRNTFFEALGKSRTLRVYSVYAGRGRESVSKEIANPVHFRQPRFVPSLFNTDHLYPFTSLVLFEIIPRRQDLNALKYQGIDIFRERMWDRFLKKLQRRLRRMEEK